MTTNFFIILLIMLPMAIISQLVRSWRLKNQPRHLGADLLEATTLSLSIALCVETDTILPDWHAVVRFIVLFGGGYLPFCFLADWIRRRSALVHGT